MAFVGLMFYFGFAEGDDALSYVLLGLLIFVWLIWNCTLYGNWAHFGTAVELVSTMRDFYMAQIFAAFFYFIIQAIVFAFWYFA